jgi:glycosyltransferase involved in cell wall biosynthesis
LTVSAFHFPSPAPTFSVIINTYNRADYLDDAIRGVLQLDYPAFELIVVNGPSTDDTEAVLARWAGRIKTASCEAANLSMSRNVGIAAAAGDLVAFLDDDAVPHPQWLSRLAGHYARPEVGAVGGFTADNTGMRWQVRKTVCDRFGFAHFVDDLFDERALNFAGTPFYPSLLGTNSSFRRAALLEIGGFDHTFSYMLDETDVCLRLVDAHWHVIYERDALVFHQFAASHIRSATRKPKTLYPSVVSKAYFVHRHGRNDGLTLQAEAMEGFRKELMRANKWLADHDDITSEHRMRLDLEVVRGIEVGAQRAAETIAHQKTVGDLPVPTDPPPFLPVSVTEPLRVVLVSQGYPPDNDTGIARWTAMAARGLADRGVSVHVITRTEREPSRRFEDGIWFHTIRADADDPAEIATAYDLPGPDLARWIAAVMREIRFLKTFGIDLVSFPIWDLEALPVLDDPEISAVISLHTTYGLAKAFKPEWSLRPIFGRRVVDRVIAAERRALDRAPRLLANSRTVVREIEEGYGLSLAGRHGIVPHGTNDLIEDAGLDIGARLDARSASEVLEVLVPARFEARKGFDLAIRLAADLADDPRIRFDFAGEELNEKVRDRALAETGIRIDRLPNARFVGKLNRKELDHRYLSCDVVLMLSRFESFGLVAIEAMSAGAPVIALTNGALPEVIEEGRSGWLIEENDDFIGRAGSLLRALADDREKIAQTARDAYDAFREHYTVNAMAEGIHRFYREAVAVKRGSR